MIKILPEEIFEMVKNILTQGYCREDRYIPDYSSLSSTVQSLKGMGYKISMTQGVYDLLHPGHTRYLNEAKSHGDILVVALDSDAYTRLRKGRANERRPIVPFEERLELLINLRSVDIVTVRDVAEHMEDPYHIIRVVQPDVLIMSSSTTDITEKDHEALRTICGKVEVLEARATVTTTSRLRELLTDGASNLANRIIETVELYFGEAGREFTLGNGKGKKDA